MQGTTSRGNDEEILYGGKRGGARKKSNKQGGGKTDKGPYLLQPSVMGGAF